MFGLLRNLYDYVQKRSEKKLTLVALGLDNAGKTTLINTFKGHLDKEVSATYGFKSETLTEGRYKVRGPCMASRDRLLTRMWAGGDV